MLIRSFLAQSLAYVLLCSSWAWMTTSIQKTNSIEIGVIRFPVCPRVHCWIYSKYNWLWTVPDNLRFELTRVQCFQCHLAVCEDGDAHPPVSSTPVPGFPWHTMTSMLSNLGLNTVILCTIMGNPPPFPIPRISGINLLLAVLLQLDPIYLSLNRPKII